MEPYKDILYGVQDWVATITINRPKTLNAFTQHTIYELEHAFRKAEADRSVGVIVITGTGERAFSSGGDVNWEKEGGTQREDYHLAEMIIDSPKAVIARVNGYCIGGANHLAYFCDITIAAEHAIFGQNGPRVGSPAGGYMVAHAANVLGHKRAREMWMLCRRYTAKQMLEWGLVNAVVPMAQLDAEVRKWADEILALSPTCIKTVKASFRHHMDTIMDQDMHQVLQKVAPNFYETGEQLEGASAFLEKRKPDFNKWR
ncbi:MAG TPA: enoyl-CoA hydratase-related protein [Methylomirabilota bacterium]|nr:enoyl-CoA hydratase-related protein [Methylomirabilota bacterium]